MSTRTTVASGNQRWGIYYTDREYARVMGDPLRTVVEAPTKLAAEEAAARLGFSEPWAHPVRPEEVQRGMVAQAPAQSSSRTRSQTLAPNPYLIMHAPTTAQIRTAIQVLKRFGEHINRNAANLIIELPETRLGAHVGDRAKVVSIEQITRIQAVTTQLEQWRAELNQQQRQCVSHND